MMGFDLTAWALNKRIISGVIFFLLAASGAMAYGTLPRAEDPGFVVRQAIVITQFPGASSSRVEELVTDPLEEGLQQLVGLDFIRSASRAGQSVITVAAEETLDDVEGFWDEMRERVAEQARELPAEAIGPFVNDDFGDVFGTVLALTGDGFNMAELEDVAEDVRRELLRLEHVAKVQLVGEAARRIFLEYDEVRLTEVGLSAQQLARELQARNILSASGRVMTREQVFELQTEGNYENVEELGATLIRAGDRAFPLRELVTLRQGYEDDPAAPSMTYTGRPAIGLAVSMTPDGKITELGPRIRQLVDQITKDLPLGLELHVASYQTAVVDDAVNTFVGNLTQSVLIVLVVMLLFLGVRTGFIVGAMLPMTILTTLTIMSVADISINKMSLTALIIALGLLVDNGVVMSESILVKRDEGRDLTEAAIETGRELRVPLLIASLTTVAALLPTYLAESTTGEYTAPIAEVVGIALLSSWVLSLTFVPLCCVLFMGPRKAGRQTAEGASGPPEGKAQLRYRAFLSLLLRWRWVGVAGAVGLFYGATVLFGYVPEQFFPGKPWPQVTVELELPEGTPQTQTDRVVKDVERFLADELLAEDWSEKEASRKVAAQVERADRPGVVSWTAYVGEGAPRYVLGYAPEQPRENFAYLLINAEDYAHQDEVLARIRNYIQERFPEASARVLPLRNGPPLRYPVEIRLSGSNIGQLRKIVRKTEERLRSLGGLVRIGNDWGPDTPTIRVDVDPIRLQQAGLTHADVAASLDTAFRGRRLSQYRDGNDVVPIELRRRDAPSATVDDVRYTSVFSQASGQSVPLLQVADVDTRFEPPVIRRRDRQRTITVRADIAPDAPRSVTAFSVADQMRGWLDAQKKTWPFGYGWEFGGEVESSGKANASIQAKQPIALLVIVLCLVFQFNTIREPSIVLLTLPFAIIGVALGLFTTQKPFGFMALLGVIALFGIVINNAIVLLDRVQIEISEGKDKSEAILDASQRRLRPILLTTATTVAGLIPLSLFGGPLFSPMAVALMSGLLVSTLLTLGLVPILYAIFHRLPRQQLRKATVLLIGVGLGAPAVARAGEPLTVDEAARRAALRTLDAESAETELQKARARNEEIIIGFVPRLGLSASYKRLSDIEQPSLFQGGTLVVTQADSGPLMPDDLAPLPAGGGNFPVLLNQTRLKAELTVPLSGYVFELAAALSAVDADADAAKAKVEAARVRAAAEARLAYYRWASAQLQIEVFEKRVEEAEERLDVTRERFEAGDAAQTEVLQAQSALSRARLELTQARTAAANAEEALRTTLLDPYDADYDLPEDLEPAELPNGMAPVPELFDEAVEKRLEIRQLEHAIDSFVSGEALTQAGGYPALELFGSISSANPNPRFIPNQEEFDTTWEAGVRLRWSPNDLFSALAETRGARADTQRLRTQLKSFRQALHREVVEARRAVMDAKANLQDAQDGLAAARAAYDQRKLTYEVGAATLLDLLQTETALVLAELDAIQARIRARTALVRLRNATGRDVDAVLDAVGN
jgi:multidrug efflux pump subunit AcrB